MIDGINDAAKFAKILYERKYTDRRMERTGVTFTGKAKHAGPAGMVCIEMVDRRYPNPLGVIEPHLFEILLRKGYWTGWSEHCHLGRRHDDYNSAGFTISQNIYEWMWDQSDKDILVDAIIIERESDSHGYAFHIPFVKADYYITENNTWTDHQEYIGQKEVGLPCRLLERWP